MSSTTKPELPDALGAPPAEQSFLGRHWQKLAALTIWLLLAGGFAWYVNSSGKGLTGAVFDIILLMQGSIWGPLIYILIYALRPITFFSAALLTIAGGFLFGPVWGVVYTVIGANASAMTAYAIGRYFGDGVLDVEGSEGLIQRYAQRMRENSFETVLIMRFIFLPYDLVSYLAGFLRTHWQAFLLATALGSILGTISFVLLGASASPQDIEALFLTGEIPSLDVRVLIASGVVFVASLAVSRYFKRRERTGADAEVAPEMGTQEA